MQTRNDHFIHYTVGYLFLAFFILASVFFSTKRLNFLVPVLFPFFFYLTGSFALIFPVTYSIYCLLYKKGTSRFILPGIILLVAILSLMVFREIMFMQPPEQYVRYPLPIFYPKELHIGDIILCVYLILFPLISRAVESLRFTDKSARQISQISSVIVLFTTLLLLGTLHDSEFTKSTRIEKLFLHQEWASLVPLSKSGSTIS